MREIANKKIIPGALKLISILNLLTGALLALFGILLILWSYNISFDLVEYGVFGFMITVLLGLIILSCGAFIAHSSLKLLRFRQKSRKVAVIVSGAWIVVALIILTSTLLSAFWAHSILPLLWIALHTYIIRYLVVSKSIKRKFS